MTEITKSEMNHLRKGELVHGGVYHLIGGSFPIGAWNAQGNGFFVGLHVQHNGTCLCNEEHIDDGPPWGKVKPMDIIENIPEGIVPQCNTYPSNPSGTVKMIENTRLRDYLVELTKRLDDVHDES